MDDETAHSDTAEYTDSLESHSLLDELKVLRQKVSQLQVDLDLAKKSTSKSLFCLTGVRILKKILYRVSGLCNYVGLV